MSRIVLVVDDEPAVLAIAASYLEELGCHVVRATTPDEALRLLSSDHRIEVFFTDVQMPGMDGYTLAKQARRIHEDLHVVAMSGRDPGRRGLPFLKKPFSFSDLERTLQQTSGLC